MEGDASDGSDDDASDEDEVFNIDGFLDIAKFDMNNIRSGDVGRYQFADLELTYRYFIYDSPFGKV